MGNQALVRGPSSATMMQESRSLSAGECGLRGEFQRSLEAHEARAKQEMQEWKSMMMENMQEIMKTQLEMALLSVGSVGADRPRKKQKVQPEVSVHSSNAKLCSICGEPGTGKDVHRHRELGVRLDGKCRKQVETFKHGGIITERREEWTATLLQAAHSDLSQKMLASLGQSTSCQTSTSNNTASPTHQGLKKDEINFDVFQGGPVYQMCSDISLDDSWCLLPDNDCMAVDIADSSDLGKSCSEDTLSIL